MASLPLLLPLAAACSPLDVLTTLVPKDAGATEAATDLAYGDHPRQRFDVYVPESGANGAPLLMFIYGGSWQGGSKEHYGYVGHAFASRGYVTAIPDYRVVPEVRYPDFVIDCAAALAAFRAVVSDFGAAPGPVFVVGHSAGAYNAVMLTLAEDLRRPAGVAIDDIAAVAGLSGPYDFLPLRVEATRRAFAGVRDLVATQPVNRVRPDAPPMFLANGGADEVVVPENVRQLGALLAAQGVRVETRVYDGLGHIGPLTALARPLRWRASVLDDILDFFAEVQGRNEAKAVRL